MRLGWKVLAFSVALCAVATAQPQVKEFRPLTQPQQQLPQAIPPNSERKCSCTGIVNRAMDCSNRDRTTFGPQDLCSGSTTEVDLSHNAFVKFPTSWGENITKVNISHNRLMSLPRAPPLNAKTTVLDVSYNSIAQSSDELRALTALQTLVVSGNRLQALDFLPAPCALRVLSADRNALRIEHAALNSCAHLKKLNLSENQLDILERGALVGLKKLENLQLKRAGLTRIEAGAFEGLKKLEHLDLSENLLTTLPSGLCSPLEELESLFLDNNKITSLPADVFTGMKKVTFISLKRNKLRNLNQGIFSGLTNLEFIKLQSNVIRDIPASTFSGLHKLVDIELAYNKLEVLHDKMFVGLRSLKYLDLFGNRLRNVPVDIFMGVPSLVTLSFDNNQLSSLTPGFLRGINSIQLLELSHNRLESVSSNDLLGPRSIHLLYLNSNNITTLPHYDVSWPEVTRINFEDNKIVDANETAIKSWLGDGSKQLSLSLTGFVSPLRNLSSLRWALNDKDVKLEVSSNCACGSITRGKAQVKFCTKVSCTGDTASWIEAVRASSPALVKV